ncbi:hypothetical protein J4433_00835 [Candidatus Pacearchaeota archaeon]|nr:hypothetical protein [Candidatus Pacearchaeota archaeon]
MKKPLEAIKQLWTDGFFENIRTKKKIEQQIWDKWKISSSNISMTLRLPSVKKFLRKEGKGFRQRFPARKEEEIQVYYFEPERPRTSRKNFISILNNIRGDVRICDPYLTNDTLEALEKIKKAKVRFLTFNNKNNIKVSQKDLQDFKKENSNIDIKGFSFNHLHDRYILTVDVLYILGHGFSVRNKESFIIELPIKLVKDLIQSLSATFDMRWKNQKNITLC